MLNAACMMLVHLGLAPKAELIQNAWLATLEDGPFYARSRIAADIAGERVEGFHESVSLQRFAARWVQCLLPVRLPRRPLAR